MMNDIIITIIIDVVSYRIRTSRRKGMQGEVRYMRGGSMLPTRSAGSASKVVVIEL